MSMYLYEMLKEILFHRVYPSKYRAKVCIACIWAVAFFIALPMALALRVEYIEYQDPCKYPYVGFQVRGKITSNCSFYSRTYSHETILLQHRTTQRRDAKLPRGNFTRPVHRTALHNILRIRSHGVTSLGLACARQRAIHQRCYVDEKQKKGNDKLSPIYSYLYGNRVEFFFYPLYLRR